VSGAREHEGNRGFYTGIVDQRAGGWHVTRFHLTLDRRLKTLWCRTRASSKWNCLKHVQTWRRRIILVLVLGQRYCGRFIFGAFGSKVCLCLTTEFVDACGSKHVHFQVPNFDPPPGLQMRHRPLETRPNLRSWDESLARGKRQNHSVSWWKRHWSLPGRIVVFQDQRTCRCAWSHRKGLSFVWIWPAQFVRLLRWQPVQMVLESHKLSVQTPSSSIRSLCENQPSLGWTKWSLN